MIAVFVAVFLISFTAERYKKNAQVSGRLYVYAVRALLLDHFQT